MEQLNEALATLINQATTGIDASMGFLQAEMPDVISQLLVWHGVKSGMVSALAIAFIVAVARIDIKVGRKLHKTLSDRGDVEIFWGLYVGVGSVIRILPYLAVFDIYVNLTWLQIWIAPKIFLIEYAANLVK